MVHFNKGFYLMIWKKCCYKLLFFSLFFFESISNPPLSTKTPKIVKTEAYSQENTDMPRNAVSGYFWGVSLLFAASFTTIDPINTAPKKPITRWIAPIVIIIRLCLLWCKIVDVEAFEAF